MIIGKLILIFSSIVVFCGYIARDLNAEPRVYQVLVGSERGEENPQPFVKNKPLKKRLEELVKSDVFESLKENVLIEDKPSKAEVGSELTYSRKYILIEWDGHLIQKLEENENPVFDTLPDSVSLILKVDYKTSF